MEFLEKVEQCKMTAYDDSLAGGCASAGGCEMAKNIVLGGMPLMGEMEELSDFYGKYCWTWKGSNTRQEKMNGSFGLGLGDSLRAGQSSSGVGLHDALQFPRETIAGGVRAFRAPAACSV